MGSRSGSRVDAKKGQRKVAKASRQGSSGNLSGPIPAGVTMKVEKMVVKRVSPAKAKVEEGLEEEKAAAALAPPDILREFKAPKKQKLWETPLNRLEEREPAALAGEGSSHAAAVVGRSNDVAQGSSAAVVSGSQGIEEGGKPRVTKRESSGSSLERRVSFICGAHSLRHCAGGEESLL